MLFAVLINLISVLFFSLYDFPALAHIDGAVLNLKSPTPIVSLAAKRGAVLAANDHFYFYTKDADTAQPIASITKLMTALVFLQNNPGWDKTYVISTADKVVGGHLNLFPGDEVKIRDLFYTSLVASDNGATLALVHATGLSESEFIIKMNEAAARLGLAQTRFQDAVGLSVNNVSTAREVARLAQAAFQEEEIRQATTKSQYSFKTVGGRDKFIESTDYLLFNPQRDAWQVLAGKTGYTEEAGYCFVGLLRDAFGREVISVVLNSADKNDRFLETKNLANWALASYNWSK